MASRSGSKTRLNSPSSRSSLKDRTKKKDEQEVEEGEEREEEKEVEQLSWRILGKIETAELSGLEGPQQIAQKLAAVLGLRRYEENLSEAALLDYYVATYCLKFSREHKFTDEQVSTLFTITHTLINKLKDEGISLTEAVQELRDLFAGVGVSQKTAVRCLTPEVAKLVVECIATGLFQHYRLFQFLFQDQQTEQNIELSLEVDVPPPASSHDPPHLDEAVSLKLYEMCMVPKPPSPLEETVESPENNNEEDLALTNLSQEEGGALMKVHPEHLKDLMDSLTSTTLSSYQDEVFSKLQDKEKAFSTRLSKLEKSLTSQS